MPLQAKKASSPSSSAWKDNPHHTRTSDTATWSMPETTSVSRQHTPRISSRLRHAPLAKKKRSRLRRTTVPDSSSDNDSTISPPGPDLKGGSGDEEKNTAGGDGDVDSWYAIKDIIDERVEKRRRFYLVDWADHPETGVSYPPSWIPARDASSHAVKAWKTSRIPARATSSIAIPGTTTPSRATLSIATPSVAYHTKTTLGGSYDFVHENIKDVKTPEPKLASRKRAASLSKPEDSTVTKKQKGLREVLQLPPALLSSDPFSRDAGTESPELGTVSAARATKALAIELNPGSDFDPDDYLRYSQLQSQSQPHPQPQSQSQSSQQQQPPAQFEPEPQPWSPTDVPEPLAPPGLQPSPQTQYYFSPQTIPDSEADIATIASTLESRSGAATLPSARASELSAPRNILSHQPESNVDRQAVVPPSNNKDELRETPDWNSEHSSGPRVFRAFTPWGPAQAPEGSRAESRNGSGCESCLFLTQPEAGFDLLSDLQSQQLVAARASASPNQLSRSPSVVIDNIRRDQPDRDLHSAQVLQLPHSRLYTLFSEERSPDSRALFTHVEEVLDKDRHENDEGQRESDSNIQHTPRLVSHLLGHELEPIFPGTAPSRPPTPSQIEEESEIGSMDADNAPLDPIVLLRKAHIDALGPDGLAMTELPSNTIKRYLAQDSNQPSPPVGDAVLPSTASAISPVLPLFGEQAALEGPPATINTSLLVGPETAMPDVSLEVGASVGATIAPIALSLTAPILSISPEPPEDEQHSVPDEAVQDSPSPTSLTDMTDRADSPASTENDRHRESLSPSAFAFYTREYTVTLPLAANSRQRYIDLIMDKENQKTIKEFGEVFSHNTHELPSAESSGRVDSLLQKLLDLSDLPPFSDSLPALTTEARMKYAANTNGKFTFLHELLGPVRAMDRKVLILARKGILLDYIEALVTQLGLPLLRIDKVSGSGLNDGSADSCRQLSVILSDTEASTTSLPQDVDFVIGFDHTARTSGLLAKYLGKPTGDSAAKAGRLPQPVVLLLVASYTLEHIDLRLPLNNTGDLERKNALLLCTLECLPYLQDSAYDDQPVKPHEAAAAFAKAFANPRTDIGWKSVSLPDDVFDIYISSSGSTHPVMSQEESVSLSNFGGKSLSRKHRLGDDVNEEDDEGAQKRARPNGFAAPIAPNKTVLLSDTLKSALHGPLTTNGQTVTISLSQLEALAARTVELESQLREKEIQEAMLLERVRTLDRLAKDTTATIVTCERKLLQAVKDRGVFETERDKAAKDAEMAKERLALHESAMVDLKAGNTRLTEKLAEATALLAGSALPDVVRLATAEAEAEAARRKAAALERKVTNAETDLAHARRAYQDASNAAADLSSENRDLSTRTKELSRLAAENLRQIHETNQRCEVNEYRRQWTEMQVIMRERERELEWAREELRVLKNGRRETRAQSVPRSPRLGVMSPRTVAGRTTAAVASAAGAGGGGGSGGGSSSSGGYNNNNNNHSNNGHRSSVSRGNSPITGNFDGGGGSGGLVGGTGKGAASLAPVPGLTYLNQQQGLGRWGHLRD